MKILYVTATGAEAEALLRVRELTAEKSFNRFRNLEIHLLVTGIGSVPTIWNMSKWISSNGLPVFAINGGIAGSFNDSIVPGDVVMPVSECFADLGIEDHDKFLTLHEAGLANADEFPFTKGCIHADEILVSRFSFLKPVKSITVNTTSGSVSTIQKLRDKYNADIETMEGASFFYLCRSERIPFLALRGISNRIEPRNRNSWNIKLALDNLAERLHEVFIMLDQIR